MAQKFPAGLNSTGLNSTGNAQPLRVIEGLKGKTTDPLEELSFGKPVRQHVREFGAVMALVTCVVAYFQFFNKTVWDPSGFNAGLGALILGLLVYGCGVVAPTALKPAWQSWMKLAHYLGFVMTIVILTTMWVAVVIPISLAVKVLGVKVMDMRFRAPVQTYWEERAAGQEDFKLLERQW